MVNDRAFVFSAGVGLDASVVERVDAHPRLKARLGEWYYTWTGVGTFNRRYLIQPPRIEVELGDDVVPGVTAIVQNAAPYTYFGDRPVEMAEGATLDSGDLAGVVLERASPVDIPTIIWRALSKRARITRHRRVHPFSGVDGLRFARGTSGHCRCRSTATTSARPMRPCSPSVARHPRRLLTLPQFGHARTSAPTARPYDRRAMRRVLFVLACLAVALLPGLVQRPLAARGRRTARSSRPTTHGTSASTDCRSRRTPLA